MNNSEQREYFAFLYNTVFQLCELTELTMLPSTGKFKEINCPFFDSGLCERKYCHFRHVQRESTEILQTPVSTVCTIDTILSLDDDEILQLSIPETVRKDTEQAELPSALACPHKSNAVECVACNLATKVTEVLAPHLATSTSSQQTYKVFTSQQVPTYEPTPISVLKNRHIPILYSPNLIKGSTPLRKRFCANESNVVQKKLKTQEFEDGGKTSVSSPSISSAFTLYDPNRVSSGSRHDESNSSLSQYSPVSIKDWKDNGFKYIPSTLEVLKQSVPYGSNSISEIKKKKIKKRVENDTEEGEKMEREIDRRESSKRSESKKLTNTDSSSKKRTERYIKKDDGDKKRSESRRKNDNEDQRRDREDTKTSERKYNEQEKVKYEVVTNTRGNEGKKTKNEVKINGSDKKHGHGKDSSSHKKSTSTHNSKSSLNSVQKNCEKCSTSAHSQKNTRGVNKSGNDKKNNKNKMYNDHSRGNRVFGHRHHKQFEEKFSNVERTLSQHANSTGKSQVVDHVNGKTVKLFPKTSDSQSSKTPNDMSPGDSSTSIREDSGATNCAEIIVIDDTLASSSDQVTVTKECYRTLREYEPNNVDKPKSSHQSRQLKEEILLPGKRRVAYEQARNSKLLRPLIKRSTPNPFLTLSERLQKARESLQALAQVQDHAIARAETSLLSPSSVNQSTSGMSLSYQPTSTPSFESTRKRICHVPNVSRLLKAKLSLQRKLKEQQLSKQSAKKDQSLMHSIAHEQTSPGSPPSVNQSTSDASSGSQSTSVLSFESTRKRIAHVPNVSMILDAKLRLQQKLKERLSTELEGDCSSTKSQTMPKGAQRVAHVPSARVLARPVLKCTGGKVPFDVRQHYLGLLVGEYLKISLSDLEAYKRAVKEETGLYQRCITRAAYDCHISNIINRLRKTRNVSASTSRNSVNRTLSYTSMLATKGNRKGSWSIEKKKSPNVNHKSLYESLSQFIMSEEQLKQNGFPMRHTQEKDLAVIHHFYNKPFIPKTPSQRMCARCSKIYYVNQQRFAMKEENCVYHWGYLSQSKTRSGWEARYNCCQGYADAIGCSFGNCHVSDNFDLNNLRGFVKTLPKEEPPSDGDYGVYSLDCEMCYTTVGLELIRITVVGTDLNIVYDRLVKPENTVLDYNTRFSGIKEDDLVNVTTNINEVQSTLLRFINDKTILIGHSLESDFKALKLIHSTVVDTSVVYPHKMDLPKKRALKSLCRDLFQKIIQENDDGHDSAEDARAAMEIILFKVKEEMKKDCKANNSSYKREDLNRLHE